MVIPIAVLIMIGIAMILPPLPNSAADATTAGAGHGPVAPPRWTGHPVPMTPFDLKLMGSGFYSISDALTERPKRALEAIWTEALSFQYRKDNGADAWQDPDITEAARVGDCEDMAVWLYRELTQNGYQRVRIMVGKFEVSEQAHHVWVTLPIAPQDDLILDPALQTRVWKRSDLSPELYVPLYSYDGTLKYDHALAG